MLSPAPHPRDRVDRERLLWSQNAADLEHLFNPFIIFNVYYNMLNNSAAQSQKAVSTCKQILPFFGFARQNCTLSLFIGGYDF